MNMDFMLSADKLVTFVLFVSPGHIFRRGVDSSGKKLKNAFASCFVSIISHPLKWIRSATYGCTQTTTAEYKTKTSEPSAEPEN